MGANSKIEWTDHTWNPWYGYPDDGQRSPACDNCYAMDWAKHFGKDFSKITRAAKRGFLAPLNKRQFKSGDKVFVCSLSDFFHPDVSNDLRDDALDLMAQRPDLTWILLTKRPEIAEKYFKSCEHGADDTDTKWPWKNLWLGVTVENQEQADK